MVVKAVVGRMKVLERVVSTKENRIQELGRELCLHVPVSREVCWSDVPARRSGGPQEDWLA